MPVHAVFMVGGEPLSVIEQHIETRNEFDPWPNIARSIASGCGRRRHKDLPSTAWPVPAASSRTGPYAAGVPYATDEGAADFHSLRAYFISALVRSGTSIKTVQALAALVLSPPPQPAAAPPGGCPRALDIRSERLAVSSIPGSPTGPASDIFLSARYRPWFEAQHRAGRSIPSSTRCCQAFGSSPTARARSGSTPTRMPWSVMCQEEMRRSTPGAGHRPSSPRRPRPGHDVDGLELVGREPFVPSAHDQASATLTWLAPMFTWRTGRASLRTWASIRRAERNPRWAESI